MNSDCLFCRIVAGSIPAEIVHDDPTSIAFRDIGPQAPTHILVIPRDHVASLNEASDPAVLGHLLHVAAMLARREGIADSGYRTVINTNGDGGQSVGHLHIHLLGGRRLSWPPG